MLCCDVLCEIILTFPPSFPTSFLPFLRLCSYAIQILTADHIATIAVHPPSSLAELLLCLRQGEAFLAQETSVAFSTELLATIWAYLQHADLLHLFPDAVEPTLPYTDAWSNPLTYVNQKEAQPAIDGSTYSANTNANTSSNLATYAEVRTQMSPVIGLR